LRGEKPNKDTTLSKQTLDSLKSRGLLFEPALQSCGSLRRHPPHNHFREQTTGN
jgi:hypothetical protein